MLMVECNAAKFNLVILQLPELIPLSGGQTSALHF